jgi:RHS repeat-associated protein
VRTSDNAILMDLMTPRNLLGMKTAISQTVNSTGNPGTYPTTYDNQNRLLSYGSQLFAYDNVGNKLQDTFPFSRTYQVNARDQLTRLSGTNGTYSISYDANGNVKELTPDAGNTAIGSNVTGPSSLATDKAIYRFDSLNRLTQVTLKAQGTLTPTVAYQYDAQGSRIARIRTNVTAPSTVVPGSGSDLSLLYTRYTLDSQLAYAQVLEERSYGEDGAYANSLNGVAAGSPLYAQATGVGNLAVSFTYDGSGAGGGNTTVISGITRLAETRNMGPGCSTLGSCVVGSGNVNANYQTYFYHADDQGSTRLITDSNGQVVAGYIYLANGEIYSRGVVPAYPNTHPTPYLYTGEHHDPETGLIYLRARYYSPVMGRFVGVDPHPGSMSSPITLNDYAYANGDSVNGVDPGGRFTLMGVGISTGVTLAIGGAVWGYSNFQRIQAADASWSSAHIAAALDSARCRPTDLNSAGLTQCRMRGLPVIRYGQDVLELTEHIKFAQEQMVPHLAGVLHYRKPGRSRDWLGRKAKKRAGQPCYGPTTSQQCDEYPFAASMQGGELNYDAGFVSLKLINGVHNMAGGGRFGTFVLNCKLKNTDAFIVLPQTGRSMTNWSC